MADSYSDLQGKVVAVTGGARGIGAEFVAEFQGIGARVAAIDINSPEGGKSAAEKFYQTDLTNEAALVATFDQIAKDFGRIDVLVNNAMFHDPANYLETSLEMWNMTLAVNLTAPFLAIRTVLPGMIARKSGSIINIGTVNAKMMIGSDAYSVSKGGLHALTRTVSTRFGEHGVRCNTIVPGTVATPAWQERIDRNPAIFNEIKKWYPLGRVGKPSDIAAAAIFLASERSSWITGIELPVDGGLLAGFNPMYKLVEGSD